MILKTSSTISSIIESSSTSPLSLSSPRVHKVAHLCISRNTYCRKSRVASTSSATCTWSLYSSLFPTSLLVSLHQPLPFGSHPSSDNFARHPSTTCAIKNTTEQTDTPHRHFLLFFAAEGIRVSSEPLRTSLRAINTHTATCDLPPDCLLPSPSSNLRQAALYGSA